MLLKYDYFVKFSTISCLLQILLVTSSRATDKWIVPGGGLEPNEDPSTCAVRETIEEAGVKGIIRRCLGTFEVLFLISVLFLDYLLIYLI